MKRFLSFIFVLCVGSVMLKAQDNPEALAYIERFKQLAMDEQIRVGLPASITLAQGLYESANGSSYLAKEGNNHFGIKCKKEWKGETILHTDDAPNECFRKYPTAQESYLDHSNYLKNNRRYAFLFDIDKNDFEGWAVGLKKAGYATNPQYAYKLIDLIKKYNLHQYTVIAARSQNIENKGNGTNTNNTPVVTDKTNDETAAFTTEPVKEEDKRVVKNTPDEDLGYAIKNNLKGFYVKKGESLLDHATKRNIRYTKLLLINDLQDGPASEDMFVYVEKKSKTGVRPYHVVREGETMIGIAQAEGMQLGAIRALNMLEVDEMPKVGESLHLIEQRTVKPATNGATIVSTTPKTEQPTPTIEPAVQTEDKNIAAELFTTESKPVKPLDEKAIAMVEKTDKPKVTGEDLANDPIVDTKTTPTPLKPIEVQPEVVDDPIINTEVKSTVADAKVADVKPTVQPPVQAVILKSPSTYQEEGLSDDIKKMKSIMDKVVYAPLPQIKPKQSETPKVTTPAKDNKSTKPNDKPVTPTTPKMVAAPAKATTPAPKKEVIADVPQTKKPATNKPTEKTDKTVIDKPTTAPKMVGAPAKSKTEIAPKKEVPQSAENMPKKNTETKPAASSTAPKMVASPAKKTTNPKTPNKQ